MSFWTTVITFVNEILTFYLPIFYTFRYLASHDPLKVKKILKFWCVLSISYILQFVYSSVLAKHLDIILNLATHVILIYDDFNYSQRIYDSIVRPLYKNNQSKINDFGLQLEKYFEEKTHEVQAKVGKNAADKIRGFVGEILVGTVNPATAKKQSSQEPTHDDPDDQKED